MFFIYLLIKALYTIVAHRHSLPINIRVKILKELPKFLTTKASELFASSLHDKTAEPILMYFSIVKI